MLAKQNKSVDSLPTDMSDNTESDGELPAPARLTRRRHSQVGRLSPPSRGGGGVPEMQRYSAWRESRDPGARDVLTRTCMLSVDDLFTLLFTNSKFFYDFQVCFSVAVLLRGIIYIFLYSNIWTSSQFYIFGGGGRSTCIVHES